ncbi:MAG TPA: PepSY domain-containing protein [Gallionella sp.]|nr:PepSY domain-containing protein [Gallionella sp.]
MPHHRKQPSKFKSLYVWHRYAGLLAALLVIVLALTGIALNHTEELQLDARFVRSSWVLDWYGIRAPETSTTYATPLAPVTLFGRQLYIGERPLTGDYDRLIGAEVIQNMLITAVDDRLLLTGAGGELLAELTILDGVPTGLRRLGRDPEGRLVVAASTGYYRPDTDFIRWKRLPKSQHDITWAQPETLTPKQRRALEHAFRNRVLPWERVLLDLHSGRIFGTFGVWVMDGAALLMLFLAASGVLGWLKRKR